jgi:NAD(P)-dependent dehydrogenase (short-subunit alcohol dehydrogenase family)
MAFDYDGRRVVVAGGSRGIGRSIVGLRAGRGRRVDLRAGRRTSRGRTPRSPHTVGAQCIGRPATSRTGTQSSATSGRPTGLTPPCNELPRPG